MIVGLLEVKLKIPESRSLKDKRRELRSIKDRVRHRFNVSICEVDNHEILNGASLAVVKVDITRRGVESTFSKIMDTITGNQRVEVLDYHMEVR